MRDAGINQQLAQIGEHMIATAPVRNGPTG